MVKQIQTIHWQQPTNGLSVSDHFLGLVFGGLKLDVYRSVELNVHVYK